MRETGPAGTSLQPLHLMKLGFATIGAAIIIIVVIIIIISHCLSHFCLYIQAHSPAS